MNGDSYRFKQSAGRRRSARTEQDQATEIVDCTGEITPQIDHRHARISAGLLLLRHAGVKNQPALTPLWELPRKPEL